MLLRPDGLRLSAALRPSRKSLKVWKKSLPRAVPRSSRQLDWMRKNAPPRRRVRPWTQERLSARVVFVARGEIVAEIAEDAEAAERSQHGDLGRLVEEAVGRRHPERRGGRCVRSMRPLRGAGEAHPGLIRQVVAAARRSGSGWRHSRAPAAPAECRDPERSACPDSPAASRTCGTDRWW